tara:strand:- start:652 stop:1317 length:666 start_codon:yes stop_codon:yes gene_type:complete
MATIDQLKSAVSFKLGVAKPNQFMVELPTDFNSNSGGILSAIRNLMSGNELNLLCQSVGVPPKTVLTLDQKMGIQARKVAYGYSGAGSLNLTFLLLNDYGIRKYFDTWYSSTVAQNTGKAIYHSNYARQIKIHQLRKPITNKKFGAGPISLNVGIGQGTVYSALLEEAYPTNITQTEFTNDADGVMQLTVEMTYTKWSPVEDNQGLFSLDASLGSLSSFLR